MSDLIFAGFLVVVILVIVAALLGKGNSAFKAATLQLEDTGAVVTRARQPSHGPVTWIWGRYAQPVPFYLRVSNRDLMAVTAGKLGVGDQKIGHERFDQTFFVRSHHPQWAREFLTPDRCEKLLAAGQVEFIVSSMENLLSPDYWPELAERDCREIWMLRIDGHPDGEPLQRQVALARELSSSLEAYSRKLTHSQEDLRAGSFEGL